jgi:quercetin dioxygenase-like cupin family protein
LTSEDDEPDKRFRPETDDFRWKGVDVLAYKAEGEAPFKDITRQTLFSDRRLRAELRYFEIGANGHSTLERHEHVHAVMILRGSGSCLVGDEVRSVRPHDLVLVPPGAWHQFRAGPAETLGFLCVVDRERDKPRTPEARDLRELEQIPEVARFLRGE